MTAIEAYEDACRTARHWQASGVTPCEAAAQLGCGHLLGWRSVIEHIAFELVIDDTRRSGAVKFQAFKLVA